jgi:hypothetical protein
MKTLQRLILRLLGVPLVRVLHYEVTQTGPDDFHVEVLLASRRCATEADIAACRKEVFAKVCRELGSHEDEVEVVRSKTTDYTGD